jgi:hypothetical protein
VKETVKFANCGWKAKSTTKLMRLLRRRIVQSKEPPQHHRGALS